MPGSDILIHHLPGRRMAPLVRASLAVHAAVVVLLVFAPALWPWGLAAVVANHLLLTLTGLWPRSTALGANMLRLPPEAASRGLVALTIDDGPDPEVTPHVLDQLRAGGARATFFCIGERAAAHPELLRRIVREGHSVQNHSQQHSHRFSLLGRRGFEREITAAQATFTQITGHAPRYFRAPAGLRNPFLDPVLQRLGLQLVSWTRRGFDTREHDPARVLARLTGRLAAGDILLLHDGNAARTAQGQPVVLAVLPALIDRCRELGLRLVTLPEASTLETPAMSAAVATP